MHTLLIKKKTHFLNSVLQVKKKRMDVWYRMVLGASVVLSASVAYPHDHSWELWFTVAAQYHDSTVPHITSPEKDQNSKCEAQFPLNVDQFHTLHSKILSQTIITREHLQDIL